MLPKLPRLESLALKVLAKHWKYCCKCCIYASKCMEERQRLLKTDHLQSFLCPSSKLSTHSESSVKTLRLSETRHEKEATCEAEAKFQSIREPGWFWSCRRCRFGSLAFPNIWGSLTRISNTAHAQRTWTDTTLTTPWWCGIQFSPHAQLFNKLSTLSFDPPLYWNVRSVESVRNDA